MTEFTIDTKNGSQPIQHYWEKCVGSCHAYTALREDYRAQLKKAHNELGFEYVRFHGIFDDDMSICVQKHDHAGNPQEIVYNFFNTDNIFDFLLSIGMKPFVELGFMPSCLASGKTIGFYYNNNVTPPKDYKLWNDFISSFVRHCVERYGEEEVADWFFEVWNEPNLSFFFDGSKEDYFTLYENTANTIKAVSKKLRVGGPATALNAWIPDMIAYCKEKALPLDFISTHHYPTDDPLWRNDLSLEEFFKSGGEKEFGKYERGILKKMTERARKEAGDYPLYYTEWNSSAMSPDNNHDVPYSAAFVAKSIVDNVGLVEAYSFWTFTDIFEENAQLPGEFHGGFGLQTVHGIPKPTYRVFELLHRLGKTRLNVTKEQGNVGMLATEYDGEIRAIIYNHNIPDGSISEEDVKVLVSGKKIQGAEVITVDEEHANPYELWQKMGSPAYPDKKQISTLISESELKTETLEVKRDVEVEFGIKPNAVKFLRIY